MGKSEACWEMGKGRKGSFLCVGEECKPQRVCMGIKQDKLNVTKSGWQRQCEAKARQEVKRDTVHLFFFFFRLFLFGVMGRDRSYN